ncbi:hypothetical protein BGL57_06125 [Helicobacter pylori]|nr:hypothetical protein [Helicobacter pylori]OPG21599.1 hypothetical protein BGL57_06125 [Helicobacter pylori]QEF26781.1 hypothetical protein D2C83_03570 [Helicobacter pylori]
MVFIKYEYSKPTLILCFLMGLLSFVHGGIQLFKNAFKGYRSTLELKLFAIKYSIKSSCKNGLYFVPLIN